MGLFKFKESRPQNLDQGFSKTNVHALPVRRGKQSLTNAKFSEYLLNSPKLIATVTTLSIMDNAIPDIDVPKAPDPEVKPAEYLRSIYAVRERTKIVHEKAKSNKLSHFDVDMSKLQDTVDYVVSIIKVSSGQSHLPPLLTVPSEILLGNMIQYHRTGDGSISKLVAGRG